MELGQFIKNYRQAHGLSMESFAKSCGVSKQYISQLERNANSHTGKPITPSINTMSAIAKAVGLPLDDLLSRLYGDTSPTLPTTDFINSLFANDPEGLARINQATIEINGLESLDSLSDETRVLIKNALLLAAQEVDRIKASK